MHNNHHHRTNSNGTTRRPDPASHPQQETQAFPFAAPPQSQSSRGAEAERTEWGQIGLEGHVSLTNRPLQQGRRRQAGRDGRRSDCSSYLLASPPLPFFQSAVAISFFPQLPAPRALAIASFASPSPPADAAALLGRFVRVRGGRAGVRLLPTSCCSPFVGRSLPPWILNNQFFPQASSLLGSTEQPAGC